MLPVCLSQDVIQHERSKKVSCVIIIAVWDVCVINTEVITMQTRKQAKNNKGVAEKTRHPFALKQAVSFTRDSLCRIAPYIVCI